MIFCGSINSGSRFRALITRTAFLGVYNWSPPPLYAGNPFVEIVKGAVRFSRDCSLNYRSREGLFAPRAPGGACNLMKDFRISNCHRVLVMQNLRVAICLFVVCLHSLLSPPLYTRRSPKPSRVGLGALPRSLHRSPFLHTRHKEQRTTKKGLSSTLQSLHL